MPRPHRDLSRREVLTTARRLAERDGVDALTMAKIAKAVGVESMSLYTHVKNKDGILDGIVDLTLQELVIPAPTGDWKDDARAVARSFRQLATAYPNTATLVLTRWQNSAAYVESADAVLNILRTAGFRVDAAVHALRALIAYIVGTLLREVGVGPTLSTPDTDQAAAQRASLLAAQGVPRVVEAATELASIDHEAEFEFGLRLLLDSLDELVRPV
ncbi:TetR/AcrR family transcriptional regulator C-terminal domain-containing protein [Streptomyces diastatochromogenes]|uniref:TetR/AcrR family transcriptional regulator C-terminal domain-containing protein n=1 Tax=Streptomyces diastatochromogenes TaxID=42236 RepID=UPI0036D0330F